ncbi:MAG TPA: hemerythrin domain-containing protein [Acidimicrobiales bacterium]|nr:hemerythrin domain-containing protein [Acidimicrobiales bacterium]
MDAITLLENDHKTVNQLFGRFQRSSKPETLSSLAREIVHELSVHAAVEEQFVYPMIRLRAEQGGELADHSIDEHATVKRLLADLEKLDATQAGFERKMGQVIDAVRHHVKEEESEILPTLRRSVKRDQLQRLGSIIEQAKAVVPTHPHPLVPGTATAQLIAGPWASVLDHLRDLLTAA